MENDFFNGTLFLGALLECQNVRLPFNLTMLIYLLI